LNCSWASQQASDGPYTPPEVAYASSLYQSVPPAQVGLQADSDGDSDGVDDADDNDRLAPANPGRKRQRAERDRLLREQRQEHKRIAQAERVRLRAEKKATKWRYGNPLLGPVTAERPEYASV